MRVSFVGKNLKVGTKPEKIVTGIASETATNGALNIYYDNSTKEELWRHNSSTNAFKSSDSSGSPVVFWPDYRADGGFTYLSRYGQLFGIARSAGPGAYATHYVYY